MNTNNNNDLTTNHVHVHVLLKSLVTFTHIILYIKPFMDIDLLNKDFKTFVCIIHSKNCGVEITPSVLIEDHTMHFTPVLNLWCYSNTFGCYFNTLWCYVQTLGCNFNTSGCGPLLTPTGVILTPQFLQCNQCLHANHTMAAFNKIQIFLF